jgi:DNA invertase Pin-like site-specific DNA recombinase
MEIKAAGYEVNYWFADDGISGATMAAARPQFGAMLERMRKGEMLVVTKIDRLGRDAIDIQQTVRKLKTLGIRVFVVQLGGTDLTSSAGKMLLAMLAAVAELERDMIVERTQAGLARARAEGTKLGRPAKTSDVERIAIRAALSAGESVSALARQHKISRASVISIRERAVS